MPPTSAPTDRDTLLSAFRLPWYFAVPVLAVALLFALFPQIDLAVSRAVYDPAQGGFYYGRYPIADVLDVFTSIASSVLLVGYLLWWLVVQRKWQVKWRVSDRMIAYLLLAFLIGPVLIVSLGFKEHWGRMRPVEVTEFGGSEPFLPYYLPHGICEDDCSFPSGHSARGFYFVAFAIAAYGFGWAHRRLILASAIGFGCLTAAMRILEGKHFLSDVTFSAIIVSYVAWGTFRLVFRHKPHRLAA